MGQEFVVLRCFSCLRFQVHQTRKDSKFVCKICNAKQSRRKIYGKGDARHCRIAVQNFNTEAGAEEFSDNFYHDGNCCTDDDHHTLLESKAKTENGNSSDEDLISGKSSQVLRQVKVSKWDSFVEKNSEREPKTEDYNRLRGEDGTVTTSQQQEESNSEELFLEQRTARTRGPVERWRGMNSRDLEFTEETFQELDLVAKASNECKNSEYGRKRLKRNAAVLPCPNVQSSTLKSAAFKKFGTIDDNFFNNLPNYEF